MKPNAKLASLKDNRKQIMKLLEELVLAPRVNALKWSAITKQTPNNKDRISGAASRLANYRYAGRAYGRSRQ